LHLPGTYPTQSAVAHQPFSILQSSPVLFPLPELPDLPVKSGDHVTIATFFRIWIPEILKDLDEVLFLDSDIIIDGDISYLLDLDVRHYPLAAAKDPATPIEKKLKLGMPPIGIILMPAS
jgi:lipopolysaccharide biosynthesis glycosyltransferase